MFDVPAKDIEAYLNFDPKRRGDLDRLDALIRQAAPNLRRYFHGGAAAGEAGMRMKMIGYGRFRYAIRTGKETPWPVIGVALQKHYISVYVSATRNEIPIVQFYVGALGEVRSGRNNFSFVSFADLNAANVSRLCREVGELIKRDPQNPVRYKQ